jgi:hypothetical protein
MLKRVDDAEALSDLADDFSGFHAAFYSTLERARKFLSNSRGPSRE